MNPKAILETYRAVSDRLLKEAISRGLVVGIRFECNRETGEPKVAVVYCEDPYGEDRIRLTDDSHYNISQIKESVDWIIENFGRNTKPNQIL